MTPFLSESNFHRKGAKSAKEFNLSLAVKYNGKRKDVAVKSDQIDLSSVPFSFPLSQRKAERNQPLRPPCLPAPVPTAGEAGRCVSVVNPIRSAPFSENIIDVPSKLQLFFLIQTFAVFESVNHLIRLGIFSSQLSNAFILNHRLNLKSA